MAAGSLLPATRLPIAEVIRLLERNGWWLARTTGSRWHCLHPVKPELTVA
jgi:predicted RNA binding protein YcfA (HicA-like mRNA interferase family)